MLRRRRDVAFDLTLRLPQERYAKNIRKEVIEFKCAFEQQQIFASSLRLKMKQQTNKNRGYHLQYKFGQYATRRSFNLRHIVILVSAKSWAKDTTFKIPMSFKMIIQDREYIYTWDARKMFTNNLKPTLRKITISIKNYFLRLVTL